MQASKTNHDGMHRFAGMVRRVRPAFASSAVARILGLHRRRVIHTGQGSFLADPISDLGYELIQGEYEPEMRATLERYLRPSQVFIDLGANEGYFTVIGSRLVGPSGTVIAVEPQSRMQSVISANLGLNGCHNVRTIKAVVSSSREDARLHLTPPLNTGGSSVYRHTKYPLPSERVQSLTLADLLDRAGVSHCDLMKIDIEGSEYEALMGAEKVLRAGIIRKIALEIHDDYLRERGLSGNDLHKWVLGCGYALNDELGARVYTFAGAQ